LKSVDGFGVVLSHVLAAEIGDIDRFDGEKNLASYSLLAPRSNDTGEPDTHRTPLGRHLGVRGNRTLKWAFIEAAHGAVRSGGRWRDRFDRATDTGKRDRGRGYIKVARELVKVVYVIWKKQVPYTDILSVRPGQKQNPGNSRSGTGQPFRPLVPAGSA
jgi:transposase